MRGAGRWFSLDLERCNPPRNCFLKPSRSSIGSTSRKRCTELLNRSLAQPARKPSHGPQRAVPNWMMESCRPSSERSDPISAPPMKRQNVSSTFFATAAACAIQSSTHRVHVPPPASWRPDAKWRSGPGSSGPACTGASLVPTPSSLCAVPNPVDDFRISGNVAHGRSKKKSPSGR